MKAYEAVTELFNAAGVETVFTLQSDGNMRLLAHMHGEWADEIRLVKARHEEAAVAMADGYARASGGLAVCTVGRGPAIAHTGAGLVTAREHGSNVLLLLPETARDAAFDIKGFAQDEYLRTTLGDVITARDQTTVLPALREGLRRVRVGEGPVAVQIAVDVLDGSLDTTTTDTVPDVGDAGGGVVEPDAERIGHAVEAYLDSDATKPPVILAGRGAVRSGAREAIDGLAERMNAVLATTVGARGYFDDHPYGIGFVGHYGGNLANELVMDADFVLAVGASLNPYTTDHGHLFPDDPKVVQIDTDPAAIERYIPVSLGIVADVTRGIEAFHGALAEEGIDRAGAFWTDALRSRITNTPPFDEDEFPATPGTIDPRDLLAYLNDHVPTDRIVVTDTGHHTRWVLDGLDTPSPREFVWPSEFGSIGLGLPMGIGAALAAPEKHCVTVCGDASFMMAAAEVETAARHHIPILIVVMNDEALGTEYHSLTTYTEHADVSIIPTPNLADLAESVGVTGHQIRSQDDLETITDTIQHPPDRPVLLDCRINRNVVHRSKR